MMHGQKWMRTYVMKTNYERYYCKTCDSLFSDTRHDVYYSYNDFIDNQARVTLGVPYNHTMRTANYHSQCPRCNSKHVIKVKPIIKLMTRKQWLRDNKGCNQYTKTQFKLYKRVMAKITATKPLSTINDK